MKISEKIILSVIAVIWFALLVLIGIRVSAINKQIAIWSSYDSFTIDNQ